MCCSHISALGSQLPALVSGVVQAVTGPSQGRQNYFKLIGEPKFCQFSNSFRRSFLTNETNLLKRNGFISNKTEKYGKKTV